MLYLNGKPVHPTIFPDHTSQVWKLDFNQISSRKATVRWEFTHEGEFMQLAQLKMLLDHHGIRNVDLELSYLPYGRQDKKVENLATFALRTFAHQLNLMKFRRVEIMDPHSDVALTCIYNSSAIYPYKALKASLELTGADIVCYPDKGAHKKYSEVYAALPHIYGEKVRDQLTGNITSYEVIGEGAGKNVLIVDDICDGGMTFKILAKELLAKGAKEVNLFVTHGIFSKGLKTLKEAGINRIFTQDGEASEVQNHIVYRKV